VPTTELPLRRDETIYQGATWRRHYRWLPGGAPIDLSAWSGRMQVRSRASAAAPVYLSLTEANGGVTLSANGDIELYATDEQTGAIPRSGRYDVELEAPDGGDVYRFVMGSVQLSTEVTR
jgi:hypothetical protein